MELISDMPSNKYFLVTVGQLGVTLEMESDFSHEDFASELATLYSNNGYIKACNTKGAWFIIKDFSAIVIFNQAQYAEYAREQERQIAMQRFNPNARA